MFEAVFRCFHPSAIELESGEGASTQAPLAEVVDKPLSTDYPPAPTPDPSGEVATPTDSPTAMLSSAQPMDVPSQSLSEETETDCVPEGACDETTKYALQREPRNYQIKLAKPGIQGENYIICLPTGTGKTLTASIVIAEHLKGKTLGERRTVLFVVPTQQLAFQQGTKLKEYIHGITVAVVVGRVENETYVHPLLPQVDAVVCTPGKLSHELYSKKLKMSDFTLIVLDECHHAFQPASSYGDVMEFYLMEKFEFGPNFVRLPQVIAMTASPGAGKTKSPTFEQAIEHQTMLCARVDATSGMKTDDSEELRKFSGNPQRITKVLEQRVFGDPFIQAIHATMLQLEGMLAVGPPSQAHTDHRYKQCIERQISAAQLRHEDQRDVLKILEHLLEYHVAIITYKDFRHQDAMKIVRGIKPSEESEATPIQCDLNHQLKILHSKLQSTSLQGNANPVLTDVEEILHSQFRINPKSRGILFVREIRHTQFVSNWINSSRLSKTIKASPITGHTRGGMPQTEQKRVMDAFSKGHYNLLVSTSLLQEGIDVPECNFVVHFQYVPDEIAAIQARGRARAESSKVYTITTTSSPLNRCKLLQMEKEELSRRAVHHLANEDISSKVPDLQKTVLQKRSDRVEKAKRHKSLWDPKKVEILCSSCKHMVCKGINVKTFGQSPNFHYVLPDAILEDKQKKLPREDSSDTRYGAVKLYDVECRTPACENKWGNISQWKDGPTLLVLKCKNAFTFRYKSETKTCKQWKLVPFHIHHYGDEPCEEEDSFPEPLDIP